MYDMSDQEPMQPVMVRMPETLYAEVKRVAEQNERSISWMIRRAVSQFLSPETPTEDIYVQTARTLQGTERLALLRQSATEANVDKATHRLVSLDPDKDAVLAAMYRAQLRATPPSR